MRRGLLVSALALTLALLAASTAVAATAIAGATYNGMGADGATVALTVSSDGTLVDSYFVTGATGHEPGGGTCTFSGEGVKGKWEGAPIVDNAFEYNLYSAILFQGTFPGNQTAAGTFRFYNAATSQTPACDTGTVSWTATTSASPPGAAGGGGSPGGGGGGSGHNPRFLTRVTLRRASSNLFRGQIKSPIGACRAGRTVVLWRGNRRMASTKSRAGGRFSFRHTSPVSGSFVRASTPSRNVKAGACVAASSTFIKG